MDSSLKLGNFREKLISELFVNLTDSKLGSISVTVSCKHYWLLMDSFSESFDLSFMNVQIGILDEK